ncbi:paraquat-inducible protein A [Halopseudomonas maritima]|uniref:paraquat-inducible protein A n=1 Tax=Halopseudomonas maritima TaxID=2918528 RepID=UPI001EEB06D9|nr:paraquat-inducible protein A [Halopseudomonas maritima]UJJ32521.1 paraquat-inducible protein A [Halopseudomonas maritima]
MSSGQSARARGLAGCHSCLLVMSIDTEHCPRCHARVHSRTPNSLQRTVALIVVACILYLPANLLPITNTVYLGSYAPSTIIGGVITLWQMGSYPIALVILIASVLVPVGKLVVLSYLCWAASRPQLANPRQCARLYRLTEFIGRWSMIDVFVVAILVALIKLGNIISFYPGFAALSFAAVVIITMIAAEQFDPRLIWDNLESNDHD